jgi:hypothetical protein
VGHAPEAEDAVTLHIRSAVSCDDTKCAEVVVDDDRFARQIAKKQGWVRVRRNGLTLDLCPTHKNGGKA